MQILSKIKSKLKSNKAKLITSLTVMSMAIMTCMSCFAEETGSVSSAVSQGVSVFSTVSSILFSNPFLLVILGLGLIPVGLKVFSSAKRSVK